MDEYADQLAPAGDPPATYRGDTTLTGLVSVDTLQRLQDRFADLGKVTVCICTVDGDPITRPTWGSLYSELIGTSPRGAEAFRKVMRNCAERSDARMALTCHEGMMVRAASIVRGGHVLALIVLGTRTEIPLPDRIRTVAAGYDIDPDELLHVAASIDPYQGGAPEAIKRFADVLGDTIATLYGQALRIKRQLADLQVVYGFAGLLASARDLQEIFDVTVRRVVEVLPVKACGMRLLNEETGELVIKAVHNLSERYLRKGPVMLADSPIDGRAFAGETVYIEDVPGDPGVRYPEDARREGLVSGLSVPMTYRGDTIGVIRVYTGQRYVFSEAEETLLRSIGSQAAAAIVNGRLHEERHAAERFHRQVQAAGQIQRRMLPTTLPKHAELEFGCVYQPTLLVGGDFYDFIELPKGNLGVCIADVVGKGLPAALMMASVRSALRARAALVYDLKLVIADVNRHLYHDTLISEFATVFYGVFTPDGRSFTYCNAGHTAPLLFRDDQFIELTTGGLVIGVSPEATYRHEVLAIHPGDVLVMTTDGVTEAMDFQGAAYGQERLRSSIRRHHSLEAQLLASQILWDVRRFAGLVEQSDDISVVAVKAR